MISLDKPPCSMKLKALFLGLLSYLEIGLLLRKRVHVLKCVKLTDSRDRHPR